MIAVPSMVTSCDDWTEIEAKDYFSATANTEAYKAQLKNYFNSPHKVMFGWFGSWSAGNISNKLIGLPDSTDFVSLWLCYGNLNEAQQADLKAFQERGSRAVLCWLSTNIGENITPGVMVFLIRTMHSSIGDTFRQQPQNLIHSRLLNMTRI